MKKSTYIAIVFGVLGSLCLGIGMCMCLLPEWNLFQEGIYMGCFGLVTFFVLWLVYRKMEQKQPIRITWKGMLLCCFAILGVLCFGIGMSLTMVFHIYVWGIVIGIVGIAVLLGLVPLCIELK